MKRWLSIMLAACLTLSMTFAGGGAARAEETATNPPAETAQSTETPIITETAQPTEMPKATETTEPTATPQAAETAEPTETSQAAETAQATETPQAAETAGPTETPQAAETAQSTPTPQATGEGEEQSTLAPETSVEPSAEPTIEADPAEDAQVWVQDGEDQVYGALKDFIEFQGTLNVCTKQVIELKGYTVEQLKQVSFAPDRAIFPEKSDVVLVSDVNPDGEMVEGSVFIWVGKKSELETLQPTPTPALDEIIVAGDQDILETEIQVSAQNYTPGEACNPTFVLSSSPELSSGQRFGVILDGGKAQALSGNQYQPDQEGQIRFVVMDSSGNILAKSSKYEIILAEATVEPEATEEPEATVEPEATEEPEATVEPEATEEPEATVEPEATEDPGATVEPESTAEPEAQARAMDAVVEIELSVQAIDYYPGEVSDIAPSFILSGLPQQGGYSYGYILNDGTPQVLEGDQYTAELQGENTLRFVILDSAGNMVARSAKYELNLDFESAENSKKQAWMMGSDGEKRYGSLQGLLAQAKAGDTLYIQSGEVMTISGGASALAGITLAPDSAVFGGNYRVKVSATGPSGESGSGLYVWVESYEPSDEPAVEVEIQAVSSDYLPGQWTNEPADFALTQIPAEAEGYEFAVIVDGGMPVILSEAQYQAAEQGQHEVSFALLDRQGNIAAQTATYSVWLDQTPPVMSAQAGLQYTLSISAADELSGGLQISLDGGTSFQEMQVQENGSFLFQYQGEQGQVFEIGSLTVKDAAGNIATNEQRIELQEGSEMGSRPNGGFGGLSGMGGGTSGSSRTVSHSSSSDSSTTAYNAVALSVEEEAMSVLTVGDEQLNLSIEAQNVQDEDFEAQFVASLQTWNGQDEETPDTLVLDAVTEGLSEEERDFLWQFDGSVYKKLAASGVDYLVLKVDDTLTAISTAGFTAGSRYNLLKSQGVASKQFLYTVQTAAEQENVEIQVSVEGENYQLSEAEDAEMYYYDVYTGGREMMDAAFGANAQ